MGRPFANGLLDQSGLVESCVPNSGHGRCGDVLRTMRGLKFAECTPVWVMRRCQIRGECFWQQQLRLSSMLCHAFSCSQWDAMTAPKIPRVVRWRFPQNRRSSEMSGHGRPMPAGKMMFGTSQPTVSTRPTIYSTSAHSSRWEVYASTTKIGENDSTSTGS